VVRKSSLVCLIFCLCCSSVWATDYRMKYNAQTGRGDWVVADTSLYQPSDTVYGASWNGVDNVPPTKNAIYDKIEALVLGGGSESTTVSDTTTLDLTLLGSDIKGDVILLKDLVTTAPLAGAADNVLVGADADLTLSITASASSVWAGLITDESGTDKVAFTTSPVFTTPNIGSATGSISGNAGTATALAADPADCGAGTCATAIAASGALTCGITPLVSGGTLTSGYMCRYDGTGIDCDRLEDASGDCAANSVCMGGHTHTEYGALAGQVWTGVHDFGSATSLEAPNGADLTLDTPGEIGVNTTHKAWCWYDGTQEVCDPSVKIAQGTWDLKAQYAVDPDLWLVDLDSASYPHGIYILKIYLDCTVADPTTEFQGDLMYADAVGAGAFPGANATVIKALDSTTGNFADAAVNTAVAADKTMYLKMDVDPVDVTTQWHLRIYYRIPES
jgi:hypothetical protein